VFAGWVYGARLAALFGGCQLFVLPSDVEGMPIVLLEAEAYGAPVLASDIIPNKDVLGDRGHYFRAADVDSLAEALVACLGDRVWAEEEALALAAEVADEYSWSRIAAETADVYAQVMGGGLAE